MPRMTPPPGGQFPATQRSIVDAIRSSDADVRRRAFNTLVGTYWKPVYKYVRLRLHADPQDAEDLTQEFFARAFEQGFLARYDSSRARFRTYLRTCVDGMAKNARRAAARLKRGGGTVMVSLDVPGAENEIAGASLLDRREADAFFQVEWVRSLFESAVSRLRTECANSGKQLHFAVFEHYDIRARNAGEPVTYAQLAEEYGLPETQVTNYLAFARRRLRVHVLDVLRELTANDSEFRAEARDVLGISDL